jgi:hypothetical protein
MVDLKKWKRAVVHLEGASDSVSLHERHRLWIEKSEKHNLGLITDEEYFSDGNVFRDLRYQGTAIFLECDGDSYLLTARHVLHDEDYVKHELKEEQERLERWPPEMQLGVLSDVVARLENTIFSNIFRVRSLDEIVKNPNSFIEEHLMNLGAGVPDMHAYTFSTRELDLAVISLRDRFDGFADDLRQQGYEPISLDDIADEPSREGVDVSTVGFPVATSVIGVRELSSAEKVWKSAVYSLPVSVFGRVSMLHEALDYFWCDMSIYPGNSGGPLIEDDKLVGIVSAQPLITGEELDDNQPIPLMGLRIPFARVIKAKHLRSLLEQQREKDRYNLSFRGA